MTYKRLTYIDLFAGAGGLSEGFLRNNFEAIAHVEMDKDACNTLKTRLAYYYLKEHHKIESYNDYLKGNISRDELWALVPKSEVETVINQEISEESIRGIFSIIDKHLKYKDVDIIIGGPPCQAYSIVGRSRDPFSMKRDPRNYLYKYYLEFLKRYQPKLFVFENVPGILSAKNGIHLQNILNGIKKAGYIVPEELPILNSKDFGVLQSRKRVIIIGIREDLNPQFPTFDKCARAWSLKKAIFSDLPKLSPGEGSLGAVQYIAPTNKYLVESKIRVNEEFTTQHLSRPNNATDLEIYKIAINLWLDYRKRLNYAELPTSLIKHNNLQSFTNRFQVVDDLEISHTVVAHIARDGHYYIYPDKDQIRSITVREAARIQSFPDNYFFEGSRTSAFKQIGNAVPPLMADIIAQKLKLLL